MWWNDLPVLKKKNVLLSNVLCCCERKMVVGLAAGNFATLLTPAQRFTIRQKGCKKYLMHTLYTGH